MEEISAPPIISIIVCTHNRAKLLQECLRSLIDQTLNKYLYEIIVVNNNSTDDTQEIVEALAKGRENIRVVIEKKIGLSHARNFGWQEAKGKYVAYIDDDAMAPPDWCDKILSAFEAVVPHPVAVGGMILPHYEKRPPSWFEDDFEIRSWGTKAGFLQSPKASRGFSGSNMALDRVILKQYGGFSSDYGMKGIQMGFGEEPELFMRIYENYPFFWYDPDIKVYHWTPIHKMRLCYRIRRSFKIGEASARLRKREALLSQRYSCSNKRSSISYRGLNDWIVSKYLLIRIMASRSIRSNHSLQTKCVLVLESLANRIGYLIGSKI